MEKNTAASEDSIREQKQRIRKNILKIRGSGDKGTLQALSERIRFRLEQHPLWLGCRFPCIYISSKPGEVDTHVLIRSALALGKRVCVPVIEPEEKDLLLVEIRELENLVQGPFGILEPVGGKRSRELVSAFDLAVAPGVAFDRSGHRIGFGKGYYDRLLALTTAPKIALAFGFQLVDTFPTLPHDVRMDYIITEDEIIVPDKI